MSIPRVLHPVLKQDFTITPITVHKRYVIDSSSFTYTSSGYKSLEAIFTTEKLKLGTGKIYPTNSIDSSYKHLLWNSIDVRYYRFPYDPFATLEHANSRFSYKSLNVSASILTIPQSDFGEGIKPGTVKISNTTYGVTIQDDINGNLYVPTVSTSSFVDRKNILFEFDPVGLNSKVISDYVEDAVYNNLTDLPDNIVYKCYSSIDADAKIKLVNVKQNSYTRPRIVFPLSEQTYGLIDNTDYFNPPGDFTISITVANPYASDSNPATQSVLNKNSVIFKNTKGFLDSVNLNELSVTKYVETASYANESTNIYPYRLELRGLALYALRSNGINTRVLNTSDLFDDGSDIVITFLKTGSQLQLWGGSFMYMTGSDNLGWCGNRHSIIIGNDNLSSTGSRGLACSGMKFFDRALSSSEISYINSNKSTNRIVGNVFYKSGTIVLSPFELSDIYTTNFVKPYVGNSKWSLEYRNTHTIYQWETVVRIPKGSFNLTMNPSALQNPYTDLLKNEFTTSLSPNSDLYPYATTIGLYNDEKELMAIGKLSQPIKMRSDVDINVAVRWDT